MFSQWKKLSILLSVVLALTLIVSCSSSAGSDPEPDTYTVTFNANGGTPVPPVQTVEAGEMATKPATNPTKGDYHFAGWFTPTDVPYNFDMPVRANITLTAKWQCVITLNANGGTFTESGEDTETIYIDVSSNLEPPAVTKVISGETWNLLGWTLDTSTTPIEYFTTSNVTDTNITLYAVWTQSYVVTFNANGGSPTPDSQAVEVGEQATEPATDPTKSGYLFRFWSADGTTEYNFTTPINANLTLTALYGLDIDTVTVNRDTREISVELFTIYTTPDEADIWFTASVDGGAAVPVTATRTSYTTSSDIAKYSFEPFVSSSKTSDLSVVITAHTSATTGAAPAFTIPQLIPVTGLAVASDDQALVISWDTADYTEAYRIVCTAASIDETITTTSYRATGLTNGTAYTFDVYRTDGNNTESDEATESGTPAITIKNSDWLFIMYLDGDNDLHDYLWKDLNEMEQGIGNNTSGTTINVIVLWDGWTGDATETPLYASEHTRIYQLGTDTRSWSSPPTMYLDRDTIDYTYTADWIVSDEVNMSSQATLENFLAWVQARYSATNTVLGFSNHGGGPRSAPLKVTLPDGRKVSMPSGRAMCWDESNGGSDFLSTGAVSDALTNQGYTGGNKLSMIMLDVCLGGSVEEAYQYRNNADYFVASPNNIPGGGFDYCDIIRQITLTDTASDVGKQLIFDYYLDYQLLNEDWEYLISSDEDFTPENIDFYNKGITLTCVKLSGMNTVKTAIDDLASVLVGTEGAQPWKASDGSDSPQTRREVIRDGLVKYNRTPGAYMSYMGTYTWLYDIGFIADQIQAVCASTEVNSWPAAHNAAGNVLAALEGAVAWASKDSYNTEVGYSNHYSGEGIDRGLTICGETVNIESSAGTATIIDGVSPDFYTAENLEFATTSSWKDLLDEWFSAP